GDLDARIGQVLGVGVALRAIADDGDLLALDQGEIGVLVVIDFHVVPRCSVQGGQSFSTRSPRPMPQIPERTVSSISSGPIAPMKASSLAWLPVSSMT